MDAPWRIELLGRLRATCGDRVVTRFRSQKTGVLLAYLAYHLHRPHPREALIDLLWPETDPHSGRSGLSRELSSLRRQLEPPGILPGAVICADRWSVQLNPVACITDVARFEAALQAAARAESTPERVERLAEAIQVYGGELLPGCFEDWVLQERQHLAEEHLGALRQLVAALERAGDLEGALEYARCAVRADPLSEEACYDLIRLYAATGQTAAALRQYQELERLLREELGETPSAATRALVEELRRAARTLVVARSAPPEVKPAIEYGAPSPAARVVAAPLRPSCPTARLPLQFTRFFGREEEIARLAETLHCPATRLVTLTGPGGSGKTRLAIAVADRLQEAFREAIAFIPLADLTDADQIPDAIVKALGLPRSADLNPLEQAVEALNRQPVLLVLDNLEHLVEQGALWVKTLLERIPTLTCLVTSRQRLSLAGEQEFAVLPLPTPKRSDSPERLLQFASVKLFVDRAQAVRADFQVTAANAGTIAALCDRLEGLPLALELAAARAGVLTPQQMLTHLEARFVFLVSRQRGASSRHQTLRGAIDWSYQLLTREMQRFFAGLSVFRGGWSLEAAVTVCEEPLALEYLEQLREASLVLTEVSPCEADIGAGMPTQMRFRLLETLREYAAEQLRPAEGATLGRRHAAYFLALAGRAALELAGPARGQWLEQLNQERENLRAALWWSMENGALEGPQNAEAVILALARALEILEASQPSHPDAMAAYACQLGCAIGLYAEDLDALRQGALLHDIGKIGIRENILLKSDRLTPEEYSEVQLHPVIGAQLCVPLRCTEDVLAVIRHHHERWDGQGYPDGLRGTQIPLLARIMAIADGFSAMVSDRPYHPAMSREEAATRLRAGASSAYDPDLVAAFLKAIGL